MEYTVRPALEADVSEISAVILRALRETNAKDYTDEIIERVERSFSPSAVLQLIGKRTVFVAAIGSRVVGTASLDGSVVRTGLCGSRCSGPGRRQAADGRNRAHGASAR